MASKPNENSVGNPTREPLRRLTAKRLTESLRDSVEPLDFITYGVIALVGWWIITEERKDLDIKGHSAQIGQAWQNAKPNLEDKVGDVLAKLHYLNRAASRVVVWRRSIIAALISSILVWFLVIRRYPKWWEITLSILLTALVFYHTWSHYNHHEVVMTSTQINNGLLQLERRLGKFPQIYNV